MIEDYDHLYGNVLLLLPSLGSFRVGEIQMIFQIGHDRASSLIESLERDGHITWWPDDNGGYYRSTRKA